MDRKLIPVRALAVLAAGALLADAQTVAYISHAGENKITVFDVSAKSEVTKITLDGWAWGLAVSPDGASLYAADANKGVAIVDTATNAITGYFSVEGAHELALSPAGKLYVNAKHSVVVVDVTNGQFLATLPLIGRIALSPDGSRLFGTVEDTAAGKNSVVILDTSTNEIIHTVPVISPSDLAVTPDGRRLYVTNTLDVRPGTCNAQDFAGVQIIDVESGQVTNDLKLRGQSCFVSVAISPDGSRAYAAEEQYYSFTTPSFPTVHVIDVNTEQEVGAFDFSPGATYALAVSADGKTLFGQGDSAFLMLDLATGHIESFRIGGDAGRIALRSAPPAAGDP